LDCNTRKKRGLIWDGEGMGQKIGVPLRKKSPWGSVNWVVLWMGDFGNAEGESSHWVATERLVG